MTKPTDDLENLTPKDYLVVKGARLHNLKDVSVAIPRNKLVVITGLSGSGKSSLAFDTIYAEGQRRYVESLSSYARQFLGKIEKPDVDYIKGVSPAVAIEQKVNTRNPRSTVGTTTEIYDYLRLLFARIGKTYSPVSGKEVKKHTTTNVVNHIVNFETDAKVAVIAPVERRVKDWKKHLQVMLAQGYSRAWHKGKIVKLDQLEKLPGSEKVIHLVIDRLVINHEDDSQENRIADSVSIAFAEGKGYCQILDLNSSKKREFSNRFEMDGISFEEPNDHFFGFNNPHGACSKCEGFGNVIGIDPDLVIPNKNLTIYDDAIVPWKGEAMMKWKNDLVYNADKFEFPIHRPIHELTDKQLDLLWSGNSYFSGLNDFFDYLEQRSYKIQYRVMLSRYRGKTTCPECNGTKLRKDAGYVKIHKKAITELLNQSIDKLLAWFNEQQFDEYDAEVGKRLLVEIKNRLSILCDVGLGYLTLNRAAATLSGGESQRINLSTSLGSSLVGSLYILDEPSIGLHSRDTQRLLKVLIGLRDLGNTVIVVEHDEEIMRAADEIIDLGPNAGSLGGNLVFQGPPTNIPETADSWTAKYLRGDEEIQLPTKRNPQKRWINIYGARENNLKNIDVSIPLNNLCVVSGVSGSGKSTLVKKILWPGLVKLKGGYGEKTGEHTSIDGDTAKIEQIEFIDQNPIGRSTRSNPATYVKAYDDIRELFAQQPMSKVRKYKPSHFSFNVDGGRCDNCQGEGEITVEMQFMADIHMTCEVCNGKKFKEAVLEVKLRDKNIHQILEMTIDDAVAFFDIEKPKTAEKRLINKLKPLQDVGLGYVTMGQSSSTLSGGEAQRIKLATYLGKSKSVDSDRILFIFDEPTTGLHTHDLEKLLDSFFALIAEGHSVVVIEHNIDIIKNADWVIELGPEAGNAGGDLIFAGKPEDLVDKLGSHTAQFLKKELIGQLNRVARA